MDGEVCVLDELGRSDFNRLQDRARRRCFYPDCDPVVFCAFDLLEIAGRSIIGLPLQASKDAVGRPADTGAGIGAVRRSLHGRRGPSDVRAGRPPAAARGPSGKAPRLALPPRGAGAGLGSGSKRKGAVSPHRFDNTSAKRSN
jgi:hypothetical protein